MFASVVPLLVRMALVHVILIWGTNNTKTGGLTPEEVQHRATGSRLVLASRIFYALFIWMAKWSILEFLKRLVGAFWHTSYEIGLQIIRYFLVVTFIAVIISTLVECHPIQHYWQVIPDPGPQCREGIAQLMTMGICDIITDIVLVAFPIPIVLRSEMPLKRKISLVLLFALSLGLVGVTAYRIPATIDRRSSQQFRSLLASFEILAETGVADAIVIGSFIRDRGVKKVKYKRGSNSGSTLDRTSTQPRDRRTTVTQHHWGSDEDLVRGLGMSLHPTLQHRNTQMGTPMAAPVALASSSASGAMTNGNDNHDERLPTDDAKWGFPNATRAIDRSDKDSVSSVSTNPKSVSTKVDTSTEQVSPGEVPAPASRKPSFFDVGGLLEHNSPESYGEPLLDSRRPSVQDFATNQRINPPQQQGSRAFIADVGGLLATHREKVKKDRSTSLSPAPKRGSSPSPSPLRHFSRGSSAYGTRSSNADQIEPHPMYRPGRDVGPSTSDASGDSGASSMDFVDVGGLLK